jgi:hypothetical protein
MGRPQQKPQAGPHQAQTVLKAVDNAKAEPAEKTQPPKAAARDDEAARRRLHPARVWPD